MLTIDPRLLARPTRVNRRDLFPEEETHSLFVGRSIGNVSMCVNEK